MDSTEQTSGINARQSRKFLLALMGMATSCAAVMLNKMTGGEFAMCLGAVLGMYGAANVGSKFADKP